MDRLIDTIKKSDFLEKDKTELIELAELFNDTMKNFKKHDELKKKEKVNEIMDIFNFKRLMQKYPLSMFRRNKRVI